MSMISKERQYTLPKGRHPHIKLLAAETFKMECSIIRIYMDIFTTGDGGYRSMAKVDLVSDRLPRFKGV